jgi:ABC-type multidrug transport system fused ATPase/permease subunit
VSPDRRHADPGLSDTLRTLGGYLRPHAAPVAIGCVLIALAGAIGLLQPLAAREMLEALARGDDLTLPLLALCGLVVLAAVALGVGNFVLLRSAERIVLGGRRQLVGHILRLTMTAMRRHKPGDLMARVTADTTLLRQIAVQALSQALLGFVLLVGALVLMGIVDLVLLATVVGVVLVLAATIGLIMPRIREAAKAAQGSVGAMGAELERALGAFTTVKASGAEAKELERVGGAAESAYHQGTRMARWSAVAGTSAGLSIQVAFLVVLAVGGARVQSGAISVATLVAFLLYVFYLTQPVLQLVNASTYFQAGRAALARIGEVRGLEVEPVDGRVVVRAASPAELRLEGVTFSYPGRDAPALSGLDLVVPAGGLTALVGPSGAGKSTVLGLLERFYDPDEGRVLVDGRDVRSWPLAELRAAIAYVEQDAPVMAGTLRENLVYAVPGASDEQLWEVIEAARLSGLVERLGGLDAEVLHRGTSLSGGERQRVAIARGLLRRPRVLLLDEATSQLDAINEADLRAAVDEVAARTTVLVVAHRLSTVRAAERIAVLQDGRLRSVGSHEELVRDDELYSAFAATQFANA